MVELRISVIIPNVADCFLLECFAATRRPVSTGTAASVSLIRRLIKLSRRYSSAWCTDLQFQQIGPILQTHASFKTPILALDWNQESSEADRMFQKGVELSVNADHWGKFCSSLKAAKHAWLYLINNGSASTCRSSAQESSSVWRITDEAASGRRRGGARPRSPIQLFRLPPNMLKVGELISPLHTPSSVWLTRRADSTVTNAIKFPPSRRGTNRNIVRLQSKDVCGDADARRNS